MDYFYRCSAMIEEAFYLRQPELYENERFWTNVSKTEKVKISKFKSEPEVYRVCETAYDAAGNKLSDSVAIFKRRNL